MAARADLLFDLLAEVEQMSTRVDVLADGRLVLQDDGNLALYKGGGHAAGCAGIERAAGHVDFEEQGDEARRVIPPGRYGRADRGVQGRERRRDGSGRRPQASEYPNCCLNWSLNSSKSKRWFWVPGCSTFSAPIRLPMRPMVSQS